MTQPKLQGGENLIFGGLIAAAGAFMGFAGISSLCGALAAGAGGFAAAVSGAGCVAAAVAGLYCAVKGAIMMGRGFIEADKSNADLRLEEDLQHGTFAVQPLTRDFDLEARRGVKVMRPLKLAAKNSPQP